MNAVKQDMPPPGGFQSIVYERVPLKSYLSGPWKWMILLGCMTIGAYGYHSDKKRWIYRRIEKRAATLSILPLLMAESDRARLKECRRLRDEEAEVMKDVPDWKVGYYYDQPIYKSLESDEWYDPNPQEFWAHTKLTGIDHPIHLLQNH